MRFGHKRGNVPELNPERGVAKPVFEYGWLKLPHNLGEKASPKQSDMIVLRRTFMKSKQIWLTISLIFILIFAAAGLAWSGIVNSASQLINLEASSTSLTSVALTAFKKVNSDGTIADFNPGSNVVVITKVIWRFKPDAAQTNPVQLKLAANAADTYYFYGKKSGVGGDGYASDNDNITPGIPVAVTNPGSYAFYVVDLVTGLPISGSMTIRLVGFLTPNQ